MMHVLLIDDEPDFTDLLGTMLRFHGITVTTLNDPTTILEHLMATRYQVIITDLMMPGLDGFGLIRTVRSESTNRATPMLALSAKVLTDHERKFLIQQHVHFVMKPFEPSALVEQILRVSGDA